MYSITCLWRLNQIQTEEEACVCVCVCVKLDLNSHQKNFFCFLSPGFLKKNNNIKKQKTALGFSLQTRASGGFHPPRQCFWTKNASWSRTFFFFFFFKILWFSFSKNHKNVRMCIPELGWHQRERTEILQREREVVFFLVFDHHFEKEKKKKKGKGESRREVK